MESKDSDFDKTRKSGGETKSQDNGEEEMKK